jgi:hypothetical protein
MVGARSLALAWIIWPACGITSAAVVLQLAPSRRLVILAEEVGPMSDWRPPSDHDAAERAQAWLARQHDQAHTQVLRLLDEAPTQAISQALDHLSTAELRALHHHLTTTTTTTTTTQRWLDQPDGTGDGL